MRFAHSEMLMLLALLPLFFVAAWLLDRSRKRALVKLLPSAEQREALSNADRGRGITKLVLLAVGLIFLIFAAARPQIGFDYVEMKRHGVDVVLAVDVSASMLAQDVAPDRLGRAKHGAIRLLDQLGGDRVAVLPFAGASTLRWPLSFDHGAAQMLIEAVDAQAVTRGGSGLAAAVDGALKLFTDDDRYEKVLVIFSDGEDLVGGVEEAGRRAAEKGLIIHSIGIGGRDGVPIPMPGQGKDAFKRDKHDKVVLTKLEPEPLQILSGLTGGIYVQATYSEDEIKEVVQRIEALTGRDLKKATAVRYKEQYQWFLIPAVALFLIEMAVGRRRRNKR